MTIEQNPTAPDITETRAYGGDKYGFGINMEQKNINTNLGVFAKTSYNDGKNGYLGIYGDRPVSELRGYSEWNSWKQKDAEIGLAFVGNGISKDHRDYLAAGGYGFIMETVN